MIHLKNMCGRYSLTADRVKLKKEFGLQDLHLKELTPRSHIVPSALVPVLLRAPNVQLQMFRWGFIPSWAKDSAVGNRMINARKETLMEKPSFQAPFQNERCLILADGFFEWKQEGVRKIPYFIRLKSQAPFGFAGLWSNWVNPNGGEIKSCTIVTCEPNELISPIHNRMPVIVPRDKREEWLDPTNHHAARLQSILQPYPADEMEAYPVKPPSTSTSSVLW